MSEAVKEKNELSIENQHFVKTKKKLDDIGCGMCLAKWTQVTIQLQTGHTHSCHHPKTHKIPLEELKRNPSALHNTIFKKKRRKEMLQGGRPKECDYCWNVEDNSDRFSDRVFKSQESWSLPHYDEIKKLDWREDFNPRYVEVAFSNACNFKCSYCAPAYSSEWFQEIEQHGGYPTTDHFNDFKYNKIEDKMPIPHRETNPYKEAFWKWWPDLYQDLHTFRITGGEPLLANDTFKVLDYIIDHPNPNKNLQFAVNTNLGGPKVLIDKFIDPEVINKVLIPKVIQTKYPELNEEQIEELRQHVVVDSVIKNGEIKEVGDQKFVRMAGRFVNIEDLHIDLIDRVNPFQKAFEVLSKSVTAKLLKVIQETIDAGRIQMTDEEAVMLYRDKIGPFMKQNNREPNINSTDPLEKRMAEAIIYLKNKKRQKANENKV